MRSVTMAVIGAGLLAAAPLAARGQDTTASGLRGVLARGARVMGVDQTTSKHRFDLVPDGARISLQADDSVPKEIDTIRAHLRSIARAFARGDFSSPAIVHGRKVPGTAVMAARRRAIAYRTQNLPRGGEVWITTEDSVALRAIGEFIRFQRADHRAGGMDSTLHRAHHPVP